MKNLFYFFRLYFLKSLLIKKIFTSLLLSLLLLPQHSCNTIEPPIDSTKPGRRDYSWTVDTLDGINNPRGRMWGSSPTDIWATSTSTWEYSISHFDGLNWQYYGVSDLTNAHAIYGFSDSEIYIGTGDRGRIWRFNGTSWNIFAELTKDGVTYLVFDNIWGKSKDDFFALGAYPAQDGGFNNTVIAHYFNGNWEMINTNGLYGIAEHLYNNLPDNKDYLLVIGGTNYTDSTKVYELIQGGYQLLYGNIWTKGLQADISLINNEVIFVLGNQIARRVNNQFQIILNVTNPNFYQRIWGRNDKDIFLLMTDGLAHYNGSDVEYLFYFNQTPRTQIYGAALLEKDVFFLVDEPLTGLSLVYHGKLN